MGQRESHKRPLQGWVWIPGAKILARAEKFDPKLQNNPSLPTLWEKGRRSPSIQIQRETQLLRGKKELLPVFG